MRREGKTIPEAMKCLVQLFAVHSSDRSTLDELYQMAGDCGSWKHAHDLFQRIRRKTLDAVRREDVKLEAQYGFEEACAKTLYNLARESAPFDSDSPYWIFPNALAAARHLKIAEGEIVSAMLA